MDLSHRGIANAEDAYMTDNSLGPRSRKPVGSEAGRPRLGGNPLLNIREDCAGGYVDLDVSGTMSRCVVLRGSKSTFGTKINQGVSCSRTRWAIPWR